MAVCNEPEPKEVFAFFEEITGIPGPSHYEEKISAYPQRFAKERGLEHYAGEKHSVIIIKEASAGYKNEPPVILQGHMDMVTGKTADCQKDTTKEGLDLYTNGDWLRTKGTTFDAGGGVALVYALVLLGSPISRRPRLELIYTVSRETDTDRTHTVDASILKGNRMLSLDSDEEGIALAGYTGGGDTDIILSVRRAAVRGEHIYLATTGLTGKYFDMEIGKGRASTVLLLARVLMGLHEDYALRLISLEGGVKCNAITRGTSTEVMLADGVSTSVLRETVKVEEAMLRREYTAIGPSLSLATAIAGSEEAALTKDSAKQVLGLMEALPYGV